MRLPRDYTGIFLANADTIYNHRSPEQQRQELIAAQVQETTTHRVSQGENLGSIARRYGTSVREIQRLNNMRGTMIRTGQRLVVNAPSRPAIQLAANTNTHVVKRGETLGVIASRYRINVNDIRQWNQIIRFYHSSRAKSCRPQTRSHCFGKSNSSNCNSGRREMKDGYFYSTQCNRVIPLIEIAGKYEHVSVDDLKEAQRSYSQFEC
jgi:LysM repeat protein